MSDELLTDFSLEITKNCPVRAHTNLLKVIFISRITEILVEKEDVQGEGKRREIILSTDVEVTIAKIFLSSNVL